MPNWKKVIVSGSDATLNSLLVTNAVTASIFSGSQFTGSFYGTASWSQNTITASVVSLQNVLNYDRALTNHNNFQGSQSGVGISSGNNINAFGQQAAYSASGNHINAFGFQAASGSTGNDVIAIGRQAAFGNTQQANIAIGIQSAQYNSGIGVIAIGVNALSPLSTVGNSKNFAIAIGYLAAGNTNTINNIVAIGI